MDSKDKIKSSLVSVIIACHNAEDYIDECLESLVNQTYNNIEIIICDDASTDDSYAILELWSKKDKRVKIIRNSQNLFAAISRNKCFEAAAGDYYMIQDIDDISNHNRIETLLSVFEKEEIDFVSSAARCFNNEMSSLGKIISHKTFPNKWDFLWGISFMHPATMFKRECITDVRGYRVSSETRRCQDYDLFMRLYAKGYKGKNIGEVLYYYRQNDDTLKRGGNLLSAKCEYKVRKYGYKLLSIPFLLSFIFSMKPWIGYLCYKIRGK